MTHDCIISRRAGTVDLPVLETIEGAHREWRIQLRQRPGDSAPPMHLGCLSRIDFILKASAGDVHVKAAVPCRIADPVEGLVCLALTQEDVSIPGLWWGAFQMFDKEDRLVDQAACRVLVAKSATSPHPGNPLTVAEVRDFLMDRCPEDNRLLMAEQFSDSQIINAMTLPVDEWNETPPFIGAHTPVSFPWRRPLLIGTCAHLLRTIGINQVRNEASYQGGNMTVNDSDKGPAFLQMAAHLREEWRVWLVAKKREINIRSGWGGSSIGEFN